jgi:serine/threonine-protein kinase HipA
MKYRPVKKIIVSLAIGPKPVRVGTLATVKRSIYFEYDPSFLDSGIEISPFRLPLKAGTFQAKPEPFEGLFGVFNDSLPDGWGRLLLDRSLKSLGIAAVELGPLDRLTHVGSHGMGNNANGVSQKYVRYEDVPLRGDRKVERERLCWYQSRRRQRSERRARAPAMRAYF